MITDYYNEKKNKMQGLFLLKRYAIMKSVIKFSETGETYDRYKRFERKSET